MSQTSLSSLPSATPAHRDPSPGSDRRILAALVVLGLAAVVLIGFIIHLTLRVKRRQEAEESGIGPFAGRVTAQDDPAAHVTPFDAGGSYSGMTMPRFRHNPGENMRIAIRRPDGAWYFADSRTPFTPQGIKELDVTPSPLSPAALTRHPPHGQLLPKTSMSSIPSTRSGNTSEEGRREWERDDLAIRGPPPPAYFREPCRDHFDEPITPSTNLKSPLR